MEENKQILMLILKRHEDISSRLGNLERHLSSSNHRLPSNIPHQPYTPYLPSIIPLIHLILLILLIHHLIPTHIISSPPLSTCNQINNASTSTFTDEDLQDLLLQFDTSTSTTTTTCPLPLPLKGKVLGAEYDSRLIHKHRLYSVETMLKTNRYLVTKHNSPATLAQ